MATGNSSPASGAEAKAISSDVANNLNLTVKHVPALDGIRGLAVLMVVMQHYGDLSRSDSQILRILNIIKETGWAGVDIFFALSGFLITGILWQKRNEHNRFKNFYIRRGLRLFPLYYAVWAFLAIYIFATHRPWRADYSAFLLYVGNFASRSPIGDFGVGHFWSLAVEEQYYIIWPFVLWRLTNKRTAMYVLIFAAFFSIILKPALIVMHLGEWGYYLLPSHMEGLAWGSFLALAAVTPGLHPYLARAGRLMPVVFFAILGLEFYFHGLPNTYPLADAFAIPLFSLGAVLLIWNSLLPGSLCGKLMNLRFLRFYGKYSYGLYVYHLLLARPLRRMIYVPLSTHIHSSLLAGTFYMAICLALLTLLAVVSFRYFESPFLKLKQKF
ncbi:MAG TPA: acyltransferase [Terracidiphilus sp.]|jgi:peptidoglycan/LPS O-acetylase OafA/YrhL